jgi:hypothetical protein
MVSCGKKSAAAEPAGIQNYTPHHHQHYLFNTCTVLQWCWGICQQALATEQEVFLLWD